VNPQREYAERHPRAPIRPPEWLSCASYMNGDAPVRWVKHLPGGLVAYEIDVPRKGRLAELLLLSRYHVRVMDAEGNIIVDVPK
jgi:hypothetical protein